MAGDAASMQMLAELEVEMMTDMYNRYILLEVFIQFATIYSGKE